MVEEAVQMQASERASEQASLIFCSLFAALFFSPLLLWGPFLHATSGSRQAVRERPSVASVFQRRRCLLRLCGVVEYFVLDSGEKVSESEFRQMLKTFLCLYLAPCYFSSGWYSAKVVSLFERFLA